MYKFLFLILLSFQTLAFAGLTEDFHALNSEEKGPFGLNYLQGASERTTVKSGQYPGGGVLFQAAFRSPSAVELIKTHNFYVGNLYTTNYYELMGEFVYGDVNSSHPLDHTALFTVAPAAIAKAALMAKHWVLEKYYIEHFPSNKIARSFLLRGIAGAEFETEYANYFFQFYLASINDDFQYLVANLLVQDSPVVDSSGLRASRDIIAQIYDDYSDKYGSNNDAIRKIYKIRNAIHNQVTPEAITMIDQILSENPGLKKDKRFANVRANLQAYFSFNVDKIISQAKKLNFTEFQTAAEKVMTSKKSPESLLQLSRKLADLKTALVLQKNISKDNLAKTIALIAQTNGYLNKELSAGNGVGSVIYIEALCNVIYSEGYLIYDNWQYYTSQIQSNPSQTKNLLAEVISVATDTLNMAMEPAFNQWKSVEPGMDKFIDNTIKASSLNAAAKNL